MHAQRAVSRINETAIGMGALRCAYKEGRNTIALCGNDAAPSIIFVKYGHGVPSRARDPTLKILNCHLLHAGASVDDIRRGCR